jgi:hypothetical protein
MDRAINFFTLPPLSRGLAWKRLVDTSLPRGRDILEEEIAEPLLDNEYYIVNPRSSVVLVAVRM